MQYIAGYWDEKCTSGNYKRVNNILIITDMNNPLTSLFYQINHAMNIGRSIKTGSHMCSVFWELQANQPDMLSNTSSQSAVGCLVDKDSAYSQTLNPPYKDCARPTSRGDFYNGAWWNAS